MEDPTWLSVLPPFLAIVVALITKQVYLSLLAGIWLGWTILGGFNPVIGLRDTIQSIVNVFQSESNTKTLMFSALIGSLIALTQRSGGVAGFIDWVTGAGYVRSPRGARVMASLLGLGVFIESSLTCLVCGAVSRPLFDRFKISREKLAYICDSTSAPVCILIPFNGWGALILGILATQGIESPLRVLLGSIPYNFYALLAVLLVFYIAWTDRDWGPMKRAERRAREEGKLVRDGATPMVSTEVLALATKEGVEPRARNMVIPMASMLLMMPVSLYITGNGSILDGSGSTAVLWSVLFAILVGSTMYWLSGIFRLGEIVDLTLQGVAGLVPLVTVLTLAFAIGSTTSALGAGAYMAQLAQGLVSPALIPAILFLMSGVIAFSTGTSWGTFAIMLPIGLPMVELGIDLNLTVAAVLAGGIFGDHCSPISDTTIVSSMAAASDHIDHVNTQLPYAIGVGVASAALFVVAALIA